MAGSEKYSFNGVNLQGTHGIVLSMVKPGSKVLECGCASGYMTKYLKEQMNCTVDIIEKDPDCFNTAKQYAGLALRADLDEDLWVDWYSGTQYDHILFADVLEHLRNPVHTLTKAVELLKDTGTVVMSIPNVCHNDIICRMFYDTFNYSDVGLLDNTHIHLFGLRNIVQMCDEAGLKITRHGTLYAKTGGTEQRMPNGMVDKRLIELLKERQYGEVYQYVLECGKK